MVDILSGAVSHALELPYPTSADDVEIWDYKSGKMPKKGSRELEDYEYQMQVYCELYRRQAGVYPARAVLIFVGELGNDERWDKAGMDPTMFPRLVYPIHPVVGSIDRAIDSFHSTVEQIEAERAKAYDRQWQAPAPSEAPGEETCDACDLRYNCAGFPSGSKLRREPL